MYLINVGDHITLKYYLLVLVCIFTFYMAEIICIKKLLPKCRKKIREQK